AGLPEGALAEVKNVICVASGKGGVGKSTLSANLAAVLAAEGHPSGALDADVWGYSIPRMLGLGAQRPKVSAERKILPLEAHGVKVMSIGFFIAEDQAVVWRGPMLHKALQQFLEDVAWGERDYLVVDLPPGTGDVSRKHAPPPPPAARDRRRRPPAGPPRPRRPRRPGDPPGRPGDRRRHADGAPGHAGARARGRAAAGGHVAPDGLAGRASATRRSRPSG